MAGVITLQQEGRLTPLFVILDSNEVVNVDAAIGARCYETSAEILLLRLRIADVNKIGFSTTIRRPDHHQRAPTTVPVECQIL